MKRSRVRRNPYTPFLIVGRDRSHKKKWYYSVSGGFTTHRSFADEFSSVSTARGRMFAIKNRLPEQIYSVSVQRG